MIDNDSTFSGYKSIAEAIVSRMNVTSTEIGYIVLERVINSFYQEVGFD